MADPKPDPIPPYKAPLSPAASARLLSVGSPPPRLVPLPFFSRLGVKHGLILTTLVLLAMTLITVLQLNATLGEIQKSAVDKGRAVAVALLPIVREDIRTPDVLRLYFNQIQKADDIDYIQVVDAQGKIVVASDSAPEDKKATQLGPDWINHLQETVGLSHYALAEPWPEGGKGVDVYVALLVDPRKASRDEIRSAQHLRIGVNFNEVLQKDRPRVIRNMLILTIVVATVMVVGLIVFLSYVLRPLRQLHIGLRALARGDLDYEVPVYSRDELGQVIQAFNATTARLKAAFEQIEALATRDHLTHMPNRRVFDERLMSEAARSRRYGHPFGLIVIDLDKFKNVNDTYGHMSGDEVLRFISKVIEANIRETDVPARVGGEEFAVILPETNFEEVRAVAEKLRTAVAAQTIRIADKSSISITISAGAACSVGHLVTPESMLAAADAALYLSKNEGRNRVTMAPRVAGKSNLMPKVEDDPSKRQTVQMEPFQHPPLPP